MQKRGVSLLGIALLSFLSMEALAEWRVDKKVDAITDREEKTAEVYNADGYKFSVYRAANNRVYGLFALPNNLVEAIAPEQPLYLRVDKQKAEKIDPGNPLADLGIKTYFWKPGFVNFLLWHGKQEEGIAPVIDQLMAGENVLIRYPVGTGGTRDVAFTLDGAKSAIATALDLSQDPGIQAKAKEAEIYKRVVTTYMTGCTKSRNASRGIACTDKYLGCSKRFPSPDWQGLDGCLKR